MADLLTLQAQIQGLRTAVEGRLQADLETGTPPTQLPWKPGEQVTATVEAQRAGDRVLLRAGQFLFDVALPVPAQLGERLRLQFVSASPRVTFALAPEDPAAAQPVARSTPVEISPSARNLAAFIQSVRADPSVAAAPTSPAQALLSAPPADALPLAAALQRAIEDSGVFYESHLKQWLAGERPLQALLREPQGRLLPAPPSAGATASAVERSAPSASGVGQTAAQALAPAAASGQANAADPQLIAHIRTQLETLDTRQFVWQGQLWPGQNAHWRIDEPPERSEAREATPAWTSHLRLVLPRLGEINAELSLQEHSLRLRLSAADPGSDTALLAAQASLVQALEQAGLRLTGFSVRNAAIAPALTRGGGQDQAEPNA